MCALRVLLAYPALSEVTRGVRRETAWTIRSSGWALLTRGLCQNSSSFTPKALANTAQARVPARAARVGW